MMNCSTCGYSVGGLCAIHRTSPGGCQDYISEQELDSFDLKAPDFNVSFDITAKITDHYIEFEKRVFDSAFEKWGYKREDLERTLAELNQYRKIGTLEEVWEAVEKTKAKKCIEDTCPDHTHYKCPICGKIQMSKYKQGRHILGRITNNCDNCGQRLESE